MGTTWTWPAGGGYGYDMDLAGPNPAKGENNKDYENAAEYVPEETPSDTILWDI